MLSFGQCDCECIAKCLDKAEPTIFVDTADVEAEDMHLVYEVEEFVEDCNDKLLSDFYGYAYPAIVVDGVYLLGKEKIYPSNLKAIPKETEYLIWVDIP